MNEESRDELFVPLSIDRVQSNKQLYFMTNGKVAGLGAIIIVFFILASVLLKGSTSIMPLIFLAIIFGILSFYYIRFVMFEESRLKKSVRDSDLNQVVRLDHFNSVQKISDEGLLEYQHRMGGGIKRAYVIGIRRGSKVGVPQGFMEQQKRVLNAFLQEIHRKGWSYDRFEMEKRPELAQTTISGLNRLRGIKVDAKRNYHRLQLETMKEFTMSDSQEIVDYYIIYNKKLDTFKFFRDNLDAIIRKTFHTSSYFKNTKVLDKKGLQIFFEDLLLLDSFDLNDIRKNVENREFSEFGILVRAIDSEGEDELFVATDDDKKNDVDKGEDIYQSIQRKEDIEYNKWLRRYKDYQRRLDVLIRNKDRDKITFSEFENRRNALFKTIIERDDFQYIEELEMLKVYNIVYGDIEEEVEDDAFDLGNEENEVEERTYGISIEDIDNSHEIEFDLGAEDEDDDDEDEVTFDFKYRR